MLVDFVVGAGYKFHCRHLETENIRQDLGLGTIDTTDIACGAS